MGEVARVLRLCFWSGRRIRWDSIANGCLFRHEYRVFAIEYGSARMSLLHASGGLLSMSSAL